MNKAFCTYTFMQNEGFETLNIPRPSPFFWLLCESPSRRWRIRLHYKNIRLWEFVLNSFGSLLVTDCPMKKTAHVKIIWLETRFRHVQVTVGETLVDDPALIPPLKLPFGESPKDIARSRRRVRVTYKTFGSLGKPSMEKHLLGPLANLCRLILYCSRQQLPFWPTLDLTP